MGSLSHRYETLKKTNSGLFQEIGRKVCLCPLLVSLACDSAVGGHSLSTAHVCLEQMV